MIEVRYAKPDAVMSDRMRELIRQNPRILTWKQIVERTARVVKMGIPADDD